MELKYVNVQGWMYEIGCDNLREIIAYAVIFGFSQDEESTFNGSLAYVQRFLMCSKPTAIETLKSLENKGLIKKNQMEVNGVKFNKFSAILPVVKKFNYPCKEILPNNNINNNTPNNPTLFDNELSHKDSIISPNGGVSESDAKFDMLWDIYDKKVQKPQAIRMWKRLKVSEQDEILRNVAKYVESTPDKQYRMNLATYINPANKRWQDEIVDRGKQESKEQDNHIWSM